MILTKTCYGIRDFGERISLNEHDTNCKPELNMNLQYYIFIQIQ